MDGWSQGQTQGPRDLPKAAREQPSHCAHIPAPQPHVRLALPSQQAQGPCFLDILSSWQGIFPPPIASLDRGRWGHQRRWEQEPSRNESPGRKERKEGGR